MKTTNKQNEASSGFPESQDSAEAGAVDRDIKDAIERVQVSIMSASLSLERVKNLELYRDLGHKSMSAYINHLCAETKMERSSIYTWLSIGEVIKKHKSELENVNFTDKDGPSKLTYLEKALDLKPKEEVFDKIKNMSKREFIAYIKSAKIESMGEVPFVEVRGNVVYIEGVRAIIINKDIGKKYSYMIMEMVRIVCNALNKGGVVTAVHHRTWKESAEYAEMAEKLRDKIQRKNDK